MSGPDVALAIFVKTPGHSPVKTRLAADLGRRFAEGFHRLASQAVAEVARRAAQIATQRDLVLVPHWAVAEAEALHDPAWSSLPALGQGEGGLGARMAHVHAQLLARYGAAILIGADAPQITPQHLVEAAAALASKAPSCVFGPAADGGFWLFGSNRPAAAATWCSVDYGRADTGDRFRRALADLGEWSELPMLTDADRKVDLATVLADLRRLPEPTAGQNTLREWLDREPAARAHAAFRRDALH